jgi:chloramphenicol-sensitive protein RarD
VLAWRGQWRWLGELRGQPKVIGAFALSALLLSVNWLVYIWAVGNGHIVDASLGYFITPLVNVVLGYTVLRERPRAAQWTALALAMTGVAWLTWQAGQLPWIALALALSFGAYGLLRKIAVLGPLEGLSLETLLLAAPAIIALVMWWGRGPQSFPTESISTNLLLVGVGPLTAVPLLLFAAGARRISMTTLGLLQYIGPSIQFGLGVWLFNEPFSNARLIGFAFIWTALALYTFDGWRSTRRVAAAVPAQGA